MKNIYYFFLFFIIISCSPKEIKIPTLGINGIQELQNHSQVWIFMEIKNKDTIAKVNRKNTISTTHWIYNIDKRLPLKSFIASVTTLQDKHANGIHSKEGMHDLFSFSDTISKKLSFVKFDKTIFKTDSVFSKSYIKDNSIEYKNYNNINVTINPGNNYINDAKMEIGELETTLADFIEFSSEGKQTMLHLNFNQNLSYQDYLFYRTQLYSLKSASILINNIEFIFDSKKVPDCGCE